ncbi:ABC transporter ATP-binding protein [Acidimangrovimonas pyrenivorans]|uniref:ABC transporter ATP-binding protein n=1 Tax=Acidimangrovimonas pyrenivorans TaxID=2030798 RepID=A0ABV7ABI3_9RHOB
MTGGALFLWIWRGYLHPHRWLLLAALVLMSVEGGMMGALSYLVKPMFDRVFVEGDKAAVFWVAFAVSGVFILRALAGLGQRILMVLSGERAVAALQADMLAHLMTLDQGFHQTHPPGSLIERVRGDTGTLRGLWTSVVAALGRDVVALVSLFAVALSVDWRWTLIAVAGAPLLVGPILLLQKLVRHTSRSARASAARLSTRLDEIFHGLTTIQLTGTEARESARFGADQKAFIGAQVRAEAGSAGIPAMMDVVAAIGFAGVLSYGGLQIIAGEKTVGEFMSFFTAIALIFEPLRRLGAVSGAWQVARASLERIREMFDRPATIVTPAKPGPVPETMRVELDDVRFAYDRDPVLNGLSFTAEPGQTTALVGPSGAGKSTVFHLLARLADPQSGAIRIGGRELHTIELGTLRNLFSVVSQDAALFDESLRDNILMGRQGVAEDKLAEALRAAHADEFTAALPQGLDTPAGPRGSGLSGGQRQRIAIARALLRDAPILLLDEATSALDAQSEALVAEALDRLSQGRTTLVIAHRLSTVRDADKIVVMKEGRVVEQGTHDELLARGGTYAELYRLQFRDSAEQ